MKEKPFHELPAGASFSIGPSIPSGQKDTFDSKPHVNEEACKNYITLLDLDEQKEISNKEDGSSIKTEPIDAKPEPAMSSKITPPLENRLKLSDLIPMKYNSNSSADYLTLGFQTEKRLEQINALSAKITSHKTAPDKTSIMKELSAFIQKKQCSLCANQECSCPKQDSSSSVTVLDTSKRKLELPPSALAPYRTGSLYSQPIFNGSRSITESDYTRYYLNQANVASSSSSSRKNKPVDDQTKAVIGRMGSKVKSTERTCGKCGLVFSTHREVLLHSRTHTEKTKEFGCHLCGKYFSQRTTLKQHLILHSGEKNFVCQSCGKRFALKIYLKTHHKSCYGLKCS